MNGFSNRTIGGFALFIGFILIISLLIIISLLSMIWVLKDQGKTNEEVQEALANTSLLNLSDEVLTGSLEYKNPYNASFTFSDAVGNVLNAFIEALFKNINTLSGVLVNWVYARGSGEGVNSMSVSRSVLTLVYIIVFLMAIRPLIMLYFLIRQLVEWIIEKIRGFGGV